MSAAAAIADHLRDLIHGAEDWASMAIMSDGSYGVPEGIFYSFPCQCDGDWRYNIVQDLARDEYSRAKMQRTADELVNELRDARAALASHGAGA